MTQVNDSGLYVQVLLSENESSPWVDMLLLLLNAVSLYSCLVFDRCKPW